MMDETEIARVAHEVNRAYCQAIGDSTQPSWDDAPKWQRDSAVDGVLYHLANPGATPKQSHENWLRRKRETGWRHGEQKDPANRLHPCMMPYDELPVAQRVKDSLFMAVVRALAPADHRRSGGSAGPLKDAKR